jgi:hypothetical protein
VRFAETGPSVREIATLREVFKELRARPPNVLLGELRGQSQLRLLTVYGPIDSPRVVEEARRRGLNVEVESTSHIDRAPRHERNGLLLIEDPELRRDVCDRMVSEGLRVVPTETD